MARALPAAELSDHRDAQPGEWQALRGELVALLDQVETQYARVRVPEPGYDALAERVRDLRYHVGETGEARRHREALRSVQRAVDRFSDREDGDVYEPRDNRRNPQHVLQSAINEIRTRQGHPVPPRTVGEIENLAQSVTGLTGRLERLEGELRTQRANAGDVKEIGDQVAQLTHVVELLAGAVGETGQVKRLEAQIAELAHTMAQAQAPDLSAMTKRIDDLAKTVERLADIQIQHLGTESKDSGARASLFQNGLAAIEESVRLVYDRIDAIERTLAMPTAEFERLTEEMASFTEALRNNGSGPDAVLPIIEAINDRIASLEGKDGVIGGLKADIGALRGKVLEAMEPRFAAIEMQIEALSGRLDEGKADAGIGHIEAQIRQLVARMDQTGEQLSSLAKLYSQHDERATPPDFEALAGLVARRTAEAMSTTGSSAGGGIDAEGIDEIERRMSRLFSSAPAASELSGMQDGIRRVGERLDRLEAALTGQNRQPEPAARMESKPAAPAPLASVESELIVPAMARKPKVRIPGPPERDDMPNNPSEDRPLTDPGFGDTMPVRIALEEKRSPADAILGRLGAGKPRVGVPVIDPDAVARPPKPASTLETPRESFVEESAPAFVVADAAPAPEPMAEPHASTSRSTFIEAARRAQRQNALKVEPDNNSVIARALARFQNGGASETERAEQAPFEPTLSKSEARKLERAQKAETKRAAKAAAKAETREFAPNVEEPRAAFLSRYRRPLLLAAALVAVSVLTLNLVAQRLAQPSETAEPATAAAAPTVETEPAPAPKTTGEANSLVLPTEEPTAVATLPDNPDIVPANLDATTVGSIDPQAAMNFTSPAEVAAIPATLKSTTLTDEELAPEPLASPVKVELPPEGVGPIELRQAAADGNARAQFEVAAILTEGHVVTQDLAAAAIWYERSAAQGFVPAEYRLGSLYEGGKGVVKDLQQARLWYQRAAEAGNRMSMHNLAALYAGGQMGKQDFAAAAEWFEQAAMRGLTDSQFNLGMLFARGLGVPQNLESSYKWFALAAASGDADAGKARDDIAKSLSSTVVSKLAADLSSWKPTPIDLAANFAPIGTWSDKFDAGQSITDKQIVTKVQGVLAKLGYDIGTPDGKVGPKTAVAIKDFEHATGMSETGAINPRLLAVLGSQPV